MKVLVLSRYSRLGASSRLRIMQYMPALSAAGFEVEAAPFFDDEYLERLYAGKKTGLKTAGYFVGRLQKLLRLKKIDVLWIEKEVFPWLPWPIEHALLPRDVPIVTDYDDAVFHRYDLHRHAAVRLLLGRKINRVMVNSALVMAGNQYLADRAAVAGARHIKIIPTVVDIDAYSLARVSEAGGCTRIGWIGSPSTWSAFGAPFTQLLEKVVSENNAVFRAVGAGTQAEMPDRFEFLSWSEENEVSLIQGMGIGIMPLPDTPWARGKCGYKLIQYMACGLPVVASPVGVNNQIVEHGVNGFLASTEREWHQALSTLSADPELRSRMGAAGRKKVEQEYSLQVYGPKVAEIFHRLLQKNAYR